MNCRPIVYVLLFLCMVCSNAAFAAEFNLKSGDSIQKLLEEYKGKRVAVRIQGNDELTGKVKSVTKDLLHLAELTGRDYFDAVIDINKISAIIVRVKE